jgi:hypothetical protein
MAAPPLVELHIEGIGLFVIKGLQNGYSYEKQAQFESNSILNRASPIINYGSSGSTTISLEFEFHTTLNNGEYEEVHSPIRSLYASQFPVDPGKKGPPVCKLTIPGTYFQEWRCVISNVSIQMIGPWATKGEAMNGTVSLSLMEIDNENRKMEDVMGKAYEAHPFNGI